MSDWRTMLFRMRGGVMFMTGTVTLALARPTPASLACGLLLGLAGEALRLWAIGFAGEPTRKETLDAPRLVTTGPYGLVRNPLYLGNVCNGLGVTLAACGGMPPDQAALLCLGNLAVLSGLYGTLMSLEQAFLERQFGEEYRSYCARVPAFWPNRLGGLSNAGYSGRVALRYESSSLCWWLASWAWLFGRME